MEDKKRLIIGISGASGAPLALDLLEKFRTLPELKSIETHLVATHGAELTLRQECGMEISLLKEYVNAVYDNDDIGACIASGSFKTMGMIIVPCSMKTVAGIVSGYSDSLLLRAADVTLKEKRKLLLAARETPLSSIHLRNLYEASMLGIQIVPPMLEYYTKAQTTAEITSYMAQRILSAFGFDTENGYEWNGVQP